MNASRTTRKAMKGGFPNSKEIWSFAICKIIVDAIGDAPAGTKKNWRDCLTYLAKRASVTPEYLYNNMTPIDFFKKIAMDHILGRDAYGRFIHPWEKFRKQWQWAEQFRNFKSRNVELPGKVMNEATRVAKDASNEERRKLKWLEERSEFEGDPLYIKRVKELEDGASINGSEECEDRMNDSADPGLCRAARKGKAKRDAREAAAREAKLKERTRKAMVNRNVAERWANADIELLTLAAKHANKANNFRTVYNGSKAQKS